MALRVSPGPLETIACARYGWYLGPIRKPMCWMQVSALRDDRRGEDRLAVSADGAMVRLEHPWFEVEVDSLRRVVARVQARPAAIDLMMSTTVALVAPLGETLLVNGAAVLSADHGHLLLGPSTSALRVARQEGRPVIEGPILALHRDRRWRVSSTPFGPDSVRRTSALSSLWHLGRVRRAITEAEPLSGAEAAAAILEHSLRPVPLLLLEQAFGLSADLGATVPAARMPANQPVWERVDQLGRAIGVRKALTTAKPELRTRLLSDSLPATSR